MDHLFSLLSPSELITPQSNPAAYDKFTTFWAAQANLKPKAVVAPSDSRSLAKVLPYLYNDTGFEIRLRGHGYTSFTTTKDILLSMHKFDSFNYNADEKTITVGAGQPWSGVYEALDRVAPKFTVVAARTPGVSVAGTIVAGGFSWLSGDLGCISDAKNLLDVEVVKYDGSIVWASQEPDLLWAIRGGGGGFGAITRAVFRLHEVPPSIYCGMIIAPRSSLPQVAAHMSRFTTSAVDPGVSVFMFIERNGFKGMHGIDFDEPDAIVFHVFDTNGEAHGRQTFKWAHDLPGAKDYTKMGTILELIRIQDSVATMSGRTNQYAVPMVVPEFTEDQVQTCVKWFTDLASRGDSVAENTFMVFELFCTRDSQDPEAMAWPGPRGCRHMLVVGVGCAADAPAEERESTVILAKAAPKILMGDDPRITPAPNSSEPWSDVAKIYGSNLGKLKEIRTRYDPKGRFTALVNDL